MNEHAPIDHAKLAESMPIEDINVSDPKLYQQDVWMHYFDRLRREAPVHYCKDSPLGPYWSITKYKDIISVEVNHKAFSSSSSFGGITLRDRTGDLELPMFIAMDQPKHDEQRKIVQPIVSPANLAKFEGLIRSRIQNTLDSLPRGEALSPIATVSPARLLRVPTCGYDGDHRHFSAVLREHHAMRWVIYFYFVLPKAARPIYVAIWLFFIAALVSDGAGH